MDYIINIELVNTPACLGWLNGVTQYWSRNLCGFAYHRSAIHPTSLVRVAISAFGEYFCRILMNEIAAFFGNYLLLNMWCFYKNS
ncbi:hypothetical protein T09_15490 [Trichinella sp. T9]|nr:hypothetical protein T09_15490 [Trichinella sp. T9]